MSFEKWLDMSPNELSVKLASRFRNSPMASALLRARPVDSVSASWCRPRQCHVPFLASQTQPGSVSAEGQGRRTMMHGVVL